MGNCCAPNQEQVTNDKRTMLESTSEDLFHLQQNHEIEPDQSFPAIMEVSEPISPHMSHQDSKLEVVREMSEASLPMPELTITDGTEHDRRDELTFSPEVEEKLIKMGAKERNIKYLIFRLGANYEVHLESEGDEDKGFKDF